MRHSSGSMFPVPLAVLCCVVRRCTAREMAFTMPSDLSRRYILYQPTTAPSFKLKHNPLFSPPRRRQVITPATSSAALPEAKLRELTSVHSLKRVAKDAVIAVSTVAATTVSGGAIAGSLHAVTGPDHLAALLPRCIGKRWYQALRIGALWGLGHGISAVIMGLIAFFLKGRLSHFSNHIMPRLSLYTEVLIGLSLIVIGLLGIKEAASFANDAPVAQSLSAAKTPPKEASSKAVFLNGLLHGFSWDGTPTLAPALAFESWAPVVAFLVSYGFGTVASMSTVTSLIGEGTVKVGEAFDRPDIPKQLSMVSSFVAIAVGAFWTWRGIAG